MTVSSTTSLIQYSGNGTTKAFSFPYPFFAFTDLVVTLFDTNAGLLVTPAPVLNGGGTYDYSCSGVQDSVSGEFLSGCTVTFNNAPLGNHRITIQRILAATQNLALIDNAKFPAGPVNSEFDRLTMLIQQALDGLVRTIQTPPSDQPGVLILPPELTRADQYLGFDASGNPVIKPPPVVVSGTLPVITFVTANNTVVDTGIYNYAAVNNQTGAALTVLLKASPADGDELTVADFTANCSATLPIIVSGNGHNIGFDATYQMVHARQATRFKYKANGAGGTWMPSGGELTLVTQSATSLTDLVSAIGSAYVAIFINQPQAVAANTTIPINVDLHVLPGGALNPASGVTVTILGNIVSKVRGIFNLSLGGSISFAGNDVMTEYVADWWNLPYGATGTDASVVLNAMVSAVPDYSTIRFTQSGGTLYLQNPWEIQGRTGLTIVGTASIEELPQVTLFDQSIPGGDGVVQFDSCGHCTIDGFWMEAGTIGVRIFNDGPPRISTNNTVKHNRINNHYSLSGFVGISIAQSGEQNNEGMQLIGNFITGNGTIGVGLGTGIYVGGGSNNHMHYLFRNAINGCATGVTGAWSGFRSVDDIFEQGGICYQLSHMSYPVEIDHVDVEGCSQLLVTTGTGGESQITLRNGRLAGSGASGVALIQLGAGGPVIIEGMDYQNFGATSGPGGVSNLNANIYSIAWSGGAQPGDCVVLRNNNYSNALNEGLPAANLLVRTGSSGAANRPIMADGDLIGALIGSDQYNPTALTVTSNTLTLTGDPVVFVTAPATINTINHAAQQQFAANIPNRLIKVKVIAAGGAITWGTTGNIVRAGTTPQNGIATLYYNGSGNDWFGDYGS